MKRTIAFLAIVLLLPFGLYAQHPLRIMVKDADTGEPLIGASVFLQGTPLNGQTNPKGEIYLKRIKEGDYIVKVSYLGYKTAIQRIQIPSITQIEVALETSSFLADEITVQATRASANTATTFKNISKEEIAKDNLGQDLPYLLAQTPSVVVSSDAGGGIGYTNITIRGSDSRRVNVTLNGIPYNDSESLGTFWVNMPDFASSIDNLQIQRGVGTSTNGAGAFGGSINIQTSGRIDTAYGELDNTVGSFNSMKNTVKIGSGLIKDKFSFDARLSRLRSDGYIDRASSNLKSYYLTGAWYGKKSLLRANVFSGKEKTYQAWNGVPENMLDSNRTYNEFTYKNQTDNYTQNHYQLLYSNSLSDQFLLNGALHYTHGEGYYEEYKEDEKLMEYGLNPVTIGDETIETTPLVRQRWLNNDFYGLTYSLRYDPASNLNLTLGGAYNVYRGNHYGEVIWAEYASNGKLGDRYYSNDANKKDFNVFVKADYRFRSIYFFADMQVRKVDYSYLGFDRNANLLQQETSLAFFNPKMGVNVRFNNSNAYASVAIAHKEPNRDDFTDSSPDSRPRPERLTDFEAGYRMSSGAYTIGLNGYAMLYKDQLVVTGQINDVGAAVRQNVPNSYRLGAELDAKWQPFKGFSWSVAAAISKNKIQEYTYYTDVYDANWELSGQKAVTLKNTDIALSANSIVSNELAFIPFKRSEVALITKFVSRQYLDNTGSKERSIAPLFVNHVRLRYQLPVRGLANIGLTLKVNNIFNELYETNGYTYGYYNPNGDLETFNYYFPQATRNFLLGLNLKF